MSHPEKISMAEATEATKVSTAVEPDVVIAPDKNIPYQKGGILNRLLRKGPKPQILVRPEEFKPEGEEPSITPENVTNSQPTTTQPGSVDVQGAVDTQAQLGQDGGIVPPGGTDGGGGRRERPPEPPEGFPRFNDEQLWSLEFRAERWRVGKELARIEGKPYRERYYNAEYRSDLSKLYRQWKYLESLDNKRSYLRKQFDHA